MPIRQTHQKVHVDVTTTPMRVHVVRGSVTNVTGSTTLEGLGDVAVAAKSDGHVLTWDAGTNRWRNEAPAAVSTPALDDLTDVEAPTPTDGQTLTWDEGSSRWVAAVPEAVPSALNDLSDVEAAAPAEGDALVWDADTSRWVNERVDAGNVTIDVAGFPLSSGEGFTDVATWAAFVEGIVSSHSEDGPDVYTVDRFYESGTFTAISAGVTPGAAGRTVWSEQSMLLLRSTGFSWVIAPLQPEPESLIVALNRVPTVGGTVTAGPFVYARKPAHMLDGTSTLVFDPTELDDHIAATTSVHGIDDIADLVVTTDPRLPPTPVGEDDGRILVVDGDSLVYGDPATPSLGLDDLTDVDAAAPADGQALVWDETSGTWQAGTVAVGASALNDLTDVHAPAPSDADVLTWDADESEWVAAQVPTFSLDLDDLGDVTAPTPSGSDVLTWDSGTSQWIAAPIPTPTPPALDDLSDVNVPTPTDGQALVWDDDDSEWVAATLAAGVTELDHLDDVNAPSPSDGQALVWDDDTSQWVPGTIAEGVSDLDDLTDVTVTDPTDGETLVYDSGTSSWVNTAPATPSVALDDLTDVTAPSPGDGQALVWDEGTSQWVAGTIEGGDTSDLTARIERLERYEIPQTATGASVGIDALDESSDLDPDGGVSVVFDALTERATAGWFIVDQPVPGAVCIGARYTGLVATVGSMADAVVSVGLSGFTGPLDGTAVVTGDGAAAWTPVASKALVDLTGDPGSDSVTALFLLDAPVTENTLAVVNATADGGTPTPPTSVGFDGVDWLWLVSPADLLAYINSFGSPSIAFDDLTDVNVPSPADGETLAFDEDSGEWVAVPPPTGATTLDDLADVDVSSPSDGQALVFDNDTSMWVAATVAGGAAALNDLTDVDAATPLDRQALLWDDAASAWVAATIGSVLPGAVSPFFALSRFGTAPVSDAGYALLPAGVRVLIDATTGEEPGGIYETDGTANLVLLAALDEFRPGDLVVYGNHYDSPGGTEFATQPTIAIRTVDDTWKAVPSIATLWDTDVSDAADGDALVYNDDVGQWVPSARVQGTGITAIVALTQTEYDALDPPDDQTLYVIVEEA